MSAVCRIHRAFAAMNKSQGSILSGWTRYWVHVARTIVGQISVVWSAIYCTWRGKYPHVAGCGSLGHHQIGNGESFNRWPSYRIPTRFPRLRKADSFLHPPYDFSNIVIRKNCRLQKLQVNPWNIPELISTMILSEKEIRIESSKQAVKTSKSNLVVSYMF